MWYSFHTELCAKNFPFIVSETLDACAYLSRDGVFAPTRRMGSLPPPRMVLSYPIPAPPCMTEKIFLSHPLRAPRSPAPSCKTLLLVNLPTTIAIVFNKICFINKNILEINNEFIPSNQTNF